MWISDCVTAILQSKQQPRQAESNAPACESMWGGPSLTRLALAYAFKHTTHKF